MGLLLAAESDAVDPATEREAVVRYLDEDVADLTDNSGDVI
jgi:hypothetical protein